MIECWLLFIILDARASIGCGETDNSGGLCAHVRHVPANSASTVAFVAILAFQAAAVAYGAYRARQSEGDFAWLVYGGIVGNALAFVGPRIVIGLS
jgi:hypothetical protein